MNMAHIAHDLQLDVRLWFERGDEDAAIKQIFDNVANFAAWVPAKRLRSISFDTKRSVHLQAADLVAREAFKHIYNKGIRRMRIPVSRLRDRLAFVLWNRETLEFLAKNGGADNIELLAEWDNLREAPRFGWYAMNRT